MHGCFLATEVWCCTNSEWLKIALALAFVTHRFGSVDRLVRPLMVNCQAFVARAWLWFMWGNVKVQGRHLCDDCFSFSKACCTNRRENILLLQNSRKSEFYLSGIIYFFLLKNDQIQLKTKLRISLNSASAFPLHSSQWL